MKHVSRNHPRAAALLATATLLVAGGSACKSELDGKTAAKVESTSAKKAGVVAAPAATAKGATLQLDASSSHLGFVGAKVTGDHKGEFKKLSGSARIEGGKPVALNVSVDMTSVESDADNLTSHLKAEDFFHVEKFSSASFVAKRFEATEAEGMTHQVTGDLELRGVKKSISFPAKIETSAGKAHGKAEFTINRKDFGIVYPGRPDNLIKDEVLLKLDLSFSGS